MPDFAESARNASSTVTRESFSETRCLNTGTVDASTTIGASRPNAETRNAGPLCGLTAPVCADAEIEAAAMLMIAKPIGRTLRLIIDLSDRKSPGDQSFGVEGRESNREPRELER